MIGKTWIETEVSPEVYKAIKTAAKRAGVSPWAFVVKWIAEGLEKIEKRP
jgi:hypothetical protein